MKNIMHTMKNKMLMMKMMTRMMIRIRAPMLVYFIARIDPSKKLTAGYVNPALAGKR